MVLIILSTWKTAPLLQRHSINSWMSIKQQCCTTLDGKYHILAPATIHLKAASKYQSVQLQHRHHWARRHFTSTHEKIMNYSTDQITVLEIAGNRSRIHCTAKSQISILENIGFTAEGDFMTMYIADDTQRRQIVSKLVSMGALFAAGRDWSPSELAGYFRDQGVFSGAYKEIFWRGPGEFEIRDL